MDLSNLRPAYLFHRKFRKNFLLDKLHYIPEMCKGTFLFNLELRMIYGERNRSAPACDQSLPYY